jgi:ABC-type branched-subunit amino acid transport system ATPase component
MRMMTEQTTGNGRDPDNFMLEVQDLYVGYYRDLHILQGIDLAVERGRMTTVLGANGVGKSTLLKAIFGFLRPAWPISPNG